MYDSNMLYPMVMDRLNRIRQAEDADRLARRTKSTDQTSYPRWLFWRRAPQSNSDSTMKLIRLVNFFRPQHALDEYKKAA